MIEISNDTYISKENIVIAQEIDGKYYITLTSGNFVIVSEEIYNEIIG